MGLLDRFRSKAAQTVDDHGDQVGQGIEKAGDVVDDKTGGKYSDKVDTAQEKATDALENLDGKDDDIK
jgi:MT0933-like antitoxin protein